MTRSLLLSLAASVVITAVAHAAPNWAEILGPSQGSAPPPLPEAGALLNLKGGPGAKEIASPITWRSDLAAALVEAKQANRPLFVTLRCLPCKQCADFDKDVLEGGPTITPLMRQFITVRLIDAGAADMRLLPMAEFQDLDMSWWGYFLSPEGQVYSVFGGKDHVSESTRISVDALASTMQRVLAHHYDPRRTAWNIDGPVPQATGAAKTAATLPGYDSWKSRQFPGAKQDCIHCHQVAEILRQPALDAKQFDKARDTQVWPLPENVGIELERDHGLLVKKVAPGSPAARAGIKSGDVLGAANGRKLFGQADFRGVLHRGPQGAGSIDVVWLRGDEVKSGTLRVADGWRKTISGWRMSLSQGNIGATPGFFPLKGPDRGGSMSVKPFFGPQSKAPAIVAGLQKSHVIIAVNGQSPAVHGRDFEWWFRSRFEPGDTVTLTVLEPSGQKKQIQYRASAKWW